MRLLEGLDMLWCSAVLVKNRVSIACHELVRIYCDKGLEVVYGFELLVVDGGHVYMRTTMLGSTRCTQCLGGGASSLLSSR
jgi:hypothetical protein